MTIIGCSVSMFFAKFTKPRIWETVREPFGDNSITGSASSIEYAVSPFWKKEGELCAFSFLIYYPSEIDTENRIKLIINGIIYAYVCSNLNFPALYFCHLLISWMNCKGSNGFWVAFHWGPFICLFMKIAFLSTQFAFQFLSLNCVRWIICIRIFCIYIYCIFNILFLVSRLRYIHYIAKYTTYCFFVVNSI